MNGACSVLQLRQCPPTSLLLRRCGFPKCPVVCFSKKMQTTANGIMDGSYVPSADTSQGSKIPDQAAVSLEAVGAFQKLPMVMPSVDILYSAMRKLKRISPTKGIANVARRERNRGAKQLDALMKELVVPLRTYKENFPDKKKLHPYERSLIELAVGNGNYEEVLGKVDMLRTKVVSVGKEHTAHCAKLKRRVHELLVSQSATINNLKTNKKL